MRTGAPRTAGSEHQCGDADHSPGTPAPPTCRRRQPHIRSIGRAQPTVNSVYNTLTSLQWPPTCHFRTTTPTMWLPRRQPASDRRSGVPGSAIKCDSTQPWPRLGSASAGFRMDGCSGCVEAGRDRRSRRSGASSASLVRGPARSSRHLRDRGYVTVADSATSRREKSVMLTSRGVDYLRTQRAAARAIEEELRAALGEAAFTALHALVEVLDDGENGADARVPSTLGR